MNFTSKKKKKERKEEKSERVTGPLGRVAGGASLKGINLSGKKIRESDGRNTRAERW